MTAFFAARSGTTLRLRAVERGLRPLFQHFPDPDDLMWSFVLAVAMAVVIMLVHTYYGYTASGGPAGVGEAVGRAVRSSLVSTAVRPAVRLAGRIRPVRQLQPGGIDHGYPTQE